MDEKSELISSSASISSTDDLLKSKTDSEEYYDDVMIASHFRNRRARWRRFLLPVIVHFILIAIYTGTTIYLLDRNDKKWDHGPHLINSPAREAHSYEFVTFDGDFTSKNVYKGTPRPELDRAWSKLLENSNIVVQKEDLDKINKTSVPVPDGSGYLVTLDVHHQLHCLKQIRHYMNQDYYKIDEPNIEVHIDHCLDDIRQMIMCKADISLLTYEWIPEYHKPFPDWTVSHECTNWEKLDSWAHEHVVDWTNVPVHPELRGGYIDPESMSRDARYFLEQVHIYEARKAKEREEKAKAIAGIEAVEGNNTN